MPELTEFEEPAFESPLYYQLLGSTYNIWTPGRVFERVFGIDSALLANKVSFWQMFGHSSPPKGVVLANYKWNFLFRLINRRLRPFPTFKVNVLIQSKRPSYRLGINADYAKNGIKGHYWQFKLTPHQQNILEKLERKLGADALVTYASPAFHKFADLDKLIVAGQIVENSTFVKPSKLIGHHKWVYDKPGTRGLACSEIEKCDDLPFKEQLGKLYSAIRNNKKGLSNDGISDDVLQNLLHLENITLEICKESEQKNSYAIAYLRRRETMIENLNNFKVQQVNIEAVRSFASFEIFTSTLNLSWWVV